MNGNKDEGEVLPCSLPHRYQNTSKHNSLNQQKNKNNSNNKKPTDKTNSLRIEDSLLIDFTMWK